MMSPWKRVVRSPEGSRIRTWTNGVPVADFDGAGILDDEDHQRHRVGLSGHVALQLHRRDDLRIRFRDIRIRPIARVRSGR